MFFGFLLGAVAGAVTAVATLHNVGATRRQQPTLHEACETLFSLSTQPADVWKSMVDEEVRKSDYNRTLLLAVTSRPTHDFEVVE